MICTELYNEQGLGNQLWNYAVTRIIAERNGYDFSILKSERFKGKDFMELDFGIPLQGGIASKRGYLFKLPNGITHYYRERKELLGQTYADISDDISRTDPKVLDLPPNTKFEGNCQSTVYLRGYREKILEWMQIKPSYLDQHIDPNVCVIHLRTGDFKHTKAFLPLDYYKNAMAYIRSINPAVAFHCVTDQKEEAEKLLPGITIIGSATMNESDTHKASHHYGGPIGIDFCLLQQAQYLIIPNSSFSWWAAYLNIHKKIVIAPKYWARFNIADGFWSPADIITDDTTYMDKEGSVFSAAQCWEEKTAFEQQHQSSFQADHPLNALWKPYHFLITAYLVFFIKKLPTIKRRVIAFVRSF